MQIITNPHVFSTLRFVARDVDDPRAALLYWLGCDEPSREGSLFDATQRFSPLMQVVFPCLYTTASTELSSTAT